MVKITLVSGIVTSSAVPRTPSGPALITWIVLELRVLGLMFLFTVNETVTDAEVTSVPGAGDSAVICGAWVSMMKLVAAPSAAKALIGSVNRFEAFPEVLTIRTRAISRFVAVVVEETVRPHAVERVGQRRAWRDREVAGGVGRRLADLDPLAGGLVQDVEEDRVALQRVRRREDVGDLAREGRRVVVRDVGETPGDARRGEHEGPRNDRGGVRVDGELEVEVAPRGARARGEGLLHSVRDRRWGCSGRRVRSPARFSMTLPPLPSRTSSYSSVGRFRPAVLIVRMLPLAVSEYESRPARL